MGNTIFLLIKFTVLNEINGVTFSLKIQYQSTPVSLNHLPTFILQVFVFATQGMSHSHAIISSFQKIRTYLGQKTS